jgi:ribose 5-phosphate isomerase RpiB
MAARLLVLFLAVRLVVMAGKLFREECPRHANVLVMGLRLTSADVASEMLDAWFATDADPEEADVIAGLEEPLG